MLLFEGNYSLALNTRSAEDRERPSLRVAMQVFAYRNYRLLWLSSAVSMLGMNAQQIIRGMLAWDLTGNFTMSAFLVLSFGLPLGLFSLLGGALADRFEKRNLILLSQAASVCIAAVTGILVLTDLINFWLLFAIGLIQGSFVSIGMPSRTPLMIDTVPEQQRLSAVALSMMPMTAMRAIGPALGGLVAGFVGFEWGYFGISFCYLLSVATVLLVPTGIGQTDRDLSSDSTSRSNQNLFGSIGSGLGFVFTNAGIRRLVLMMMIIGAIGMPLQTQFPGFVESELMPANSNWQFWAGAMVAIGGLGGLIGSILVARLTQSNRKPMIQWIAGIIGSLSIASIWIFSSFGFVGVIMPIFISGGAMTAFMGVNQAMMMDEAPPEYRGRVMSLFMFSMAFLSLSAAPMGRIADVISAATLFGILGLLMAALLVVIGLSSRAKTFGIEAVKSPRNGPARDLISTTPAELTDR